MELFKKFLDLANRAQFESPFPRVEEANFFIISVKCGEQEEGEMFPSAFGNLPFPVCWFQFSEDKTVHSLALEEDKIEGVCGSLIWEYAPEKVRSLHLGFNVHTGEFKLISGTPRTNLLTTNVVGTWLRYLGMNDAGLQITNERVKYRENGEKKLLKIRKIVRVFPKKTVLTKEDIEERQHIDFSHRFSVRGHWRKISGIGKDRAGNYSIEGFTFVNDFIKGPEHLPFVKKNRVLLPGPHSAPR